MWGEVLSLVDDEKHSLQAAAADVGQRRDHELLRFPHVVDPLGRLGLLAALVADDGEVVVEGLHVGVEFVGDVPGEESEVAVGEGHDRPGEHDLPVTLPALERRRQGEERLAGAGGAGDRHELHGVVHQGAEGERLLGVPRGDPVARLLLDPHERVGIATVAGDRRLAAVAEDEVLVRKRGLDGGQGSGRNRPRWPVETVDRGAVDPLDDPFTGVERVESADFVRRVILRADADRLRLHPQIRILGDEDYLPARIVPLDGKCCPQDAVVGGVLEKRIVEADAGAGAEDHPDRPQPLAQRAPLRREHVAGEGVKAAEELAGLEMDVFVAPLELVELLENGDRNRDVVLLELPNAAAVVEDDVGVEDEEFGGQHRILALLRRRFPCLLSGRPWPGAGACGCSCGGDPVEGRRG